jgi:PAS domain S-box-containing protein
MSQGEANDDTRAPSAGGNQRAQQKEEAAALRKRAEQVLALRARNLRELDETDILVLLHELQVHQVELEMQNEELRRAQVELQAAAERFSNLYDFAPVGYLTLDENGVILEANVTLTRQLGLERSRLLSTVFTRYVHPDDRAEFFLFRRRLWQAQEDIESSEIRIVPKNEVEFWAHLEGRRWPGSEGDRVWRIAVSDVTERRNAAEFLKQVNEELERRVAERTERLSNTNQQLLDEIARRREAELMLRDREEVLEQRVEDRTRGLQSLLDISHSVVSTLQLQQVVSLILEHLQQAIGYSGCAVYLLDGQTLRVLDYRGPLDRKEVLGIQLPLPLTAGVREVVSSKAPVIIEDLRSDSPLAIEWRAQAEQTKLRLLESARSWMAVPLMTKDRAIGALRLDHEQPGYFRNHHAQLALAIANQTAVAVENARLYQQAQQLAAMEERQRLARELHDSVAQTFYSIALAAHTLKEGQAARDAKAKTVIDRIIDLCDAGLAEARAVIFALRPETVEREGLVRALERQITAFRARGDIEFATVLVEEPDAPVEVKEALYRIAQEALRNVVRHASARHASVRLAHEDGQLWLEIVDDGVGFDADADHSGLGLQSMRERIAALNGTLEVTSQPGQGTRVKVRVAARQDE